MQVDSAAELGVDATGEDACDRPRTCIGDNANLAVHPLASAYPRMVAPSAGGPRDPDLGKQRVSSQGWDRCRISRKPEGVWLQYAYR